MSLDPNESPEFKTLRLLIEQGIAALERGEYTEVHDAELHAYFKGLATTPVTGR